MAFLCLLNEQANKLIAIEAYCARTGCLCAHRLCTFVVLFLSTSRRVPNRFFEQSYYCSPTHSVGLSTFVSALEFERPAQCAYGLSMPSRSQNDFLDVGKQRASDASSRADHHRATTTITHKSSSLWSRWTLSALRSNVLCAQRRPRRRRQLRATKLVATVQRCEKGLYRPHVSFALQTSERLHCLVCLRHYCCLTMDITDAFSQPTSVHNEALLPERESETGRTQTLNAQASKWLGSCFIIVH